MKSRYIHAPTELPTDASILIYGAGGRGTSFMELSQNCGIRVQGFIDSFKSGKLHGLPIIHVDELNQALATPKFSGALVVIASAFHRKINKMLQERAIDNYIYLDPGEGLPLVDVPVNNLPAILNTHSHPLSVARKQAVTQKSGHTLRCHSLSSIYFRPSGLSLCCWMPDLVEIPPNGSTTELTAALRRLDAIRHELAKALDHGLCHYCAVCPEAATARIAPLSNKFTGLHLDVSTQCNLSCTYCIVKNTFRGVDYDFKALCNLALQYEFTVEKPIFDWGGAGEPTLFPEFEALTSTLLERGGNGLVYTNALRYSEGIANGLAKGRLRIVCSIDAGTRKTYALVRGVDAFEKVWSNLRRYLADGAIGVMLKYIITENNAHAEEIKSFVTRCVEERVRSVQISHDFYQNEISVQEKLAMELMTDLCRKAGIQVHILGTAVPETLAKSLTNETR